MSLDGLMVFARSPRPAAIERWFVVLASPRPAVPKTPSMEAETRPLPRMRN